MAHRLRHILHKSPLKDGAVQARITILALLLLSAGATNASADAPVEGAIPPKEGALSPLRPEAVPEAERDLKLGATPGRTALHITLPPASRTERATQATGRGPVPVAFHRDMPEQFQGDLSSRLEWTPLDDGSIAAAMSVTSPGATDMRMGVQVYLPPGGEIRFFGADADRRFPVITRADLAFKGDKAQTLWSPVVEGDTIGVEIALPSRAALPAFSFSVDRISHGYGAERAFELESRPNAVICPNHLDYQCGVDRGRFPQRQGNATALLRYEKSGSGFSCSGTLLNDRDDSTFIPYLLTANHCISTQDVADTLSVRWFYRRSACGGGGIDSRDTTTSGGADVLATSEAQDSTLLRLEGSLPGGLLYAGWRINPITHPARVLGIHHPAGEVKRYALGTTTRFWDWTGCDDPVLGIGCASRVNGIEVDWSEGTTEFGSSGSGLFLADGSDHYLIGVMSSLNGSCVDMLTGYGNFGDFYPRIRRWLDAGALPPPPPADDHGNTEADATRVSIPSTTRGRLERGGDRDWFRVTVSRADRLRVETTGGTDTHGALFAEGGRRIAEDDDGGDGRNFRIAADVQPGAHYIEVRGYDGATTGDYSLEVELSVLAPEPGRHTLPLLMPASDLRQQGFVRIINRSARAGTVRIEAIDDSGRRFGPVTLSLDADVAVAFSSRDLERGSSLKRLSGGVGDGDGNWWLELRTDLDIEARAYVRSVDGFLTGTHQRAAETAPGSKRYHVPFFNPGSNLGFRSVLRLINPGTEAASIVISARDARGAASPGGEVHLTLAPGAVRMLNAQELERGGAGFFGSLGDGQGKWRLSVSADRAIQVMSLLQSRSGNISNVSR